MIFARVARYAHMWWRFFAYAEAFEHRPVTVSRGLEEGRHVGILLVGCSCGTIFARAPECFSKLSDEQVRQHLRSV